MKPYYKFIDHTADVLFEAGGNSLEELFEQCALALEEIQVDVNKLESKKKIIIEGKNKDIERLLFDFLDDLLFYKDAELLLFGKFDISISQEDGEYKLKCVAHGEELDVSRHDPRVDVKAITMHLFEVKKKGEWWWAKVLVDI